MKKYLSHILISVFLLTILVGVGGNVFSPHIVHAQTTPPTSQSPSITVGNQGDDSWGASLGKWILKIGATTALSITSLVTMLGGTSLNYAMCYTVVNMAHNYSGITSINTAWGAIRDLANMGFIFVLLYASIQMILGEGKDTRKLIVNIIIAALLINFSMFFTKMVVDASNILAMTFYKAIAPAATDCSTVLNAGLSNSVMSVTGLQSLWNANNAGLKDLQIITIGIMGSVVNLIAGFVFFATALLFFIRYVVLILVLILSPIAVVANIIPGLSGPAKQWKDALFGQAFFAPVYLMLTWIALLILNDSSFTALRGSGNLASAIAGGDSAATASVSYSASSIGLIVNFIIVIIFLIAALIIAKQMADKAGGAVSKLTGKALGFAGGATLGVAGRFGRGTVGRIGQVIADNEKLKAAAPTSRLARLALATGNKGAKSTFDFRGTTLGGELGAGKAKTGGFAKDMKDKIEAQKKFADSLKPSDLVVNRAETVLNEAKKSGTKEEIAAAQAELDRIQGAGVETMRERKLKELRATGMSKRDAREELDRLETERLKRVNYLRQIGMSEQDAKNTAKTEGAGWEAEEAKGLGNIRKEEYAKGIQEGSTPIGIPFTKFQTKIPHFSLTGRVGFIGQVKKEGLASAIAIRKSIKEKKASEKIADEIAKQAKEAGDESGTPSTPSATPPTGGAGGPTPSGGAPTTP